MSLQTQIDNINFQINQLDETREKLLLELKQLEHKQYIIDMALDDDMRVNMKYEIDRVEKMTPENRNKERKKKRSII